MPLLEMWGGIECSVARIGDTWRDQVRDTGHHDHAHDLLRIAELGIRTLRYPVLWERCHPGQPGADWSWHDRQFDTNLGHTFSTPRLRDQAEYENNRRWLGLDLLCGRVDHAHPWRAHLLAGGVTARDIDELATGEATPDMVGVNHYVTSDRFLDHRLHLYPQHLHGGNGQIAYADTEAARVDMPIGETGWVMALRDVWQRYGLPIAITEAHLGCNDPREQVRWLMEAWRAAQKVRAEGADVRAVTAWALLGLVDWDTMLVERNGRFEPGALAARAGAPRSTLLAEAIAGLARENHFTHPALLSLGWWQRGDRTLPVRA